MIPAIHIKRWTTSKIRKITNNINMAAIHVYPPYANVRAKDSYCTFSSSLTHTGARIRKTIKAIMIICVFVAAGKAALTLKNTYA